MLRASSLLVQAGCWLWNLSAIVRWIEDPPPSEHKEHLVLAMGIVGIDNVPYCFGKFQFGVSNSESWGGDEVGKAFFSGWQQP